MRAVTLHVLCEGDTEFNFVSTVLRPHLLRSGNVFAKPRYLSPDARGVVSFERLREEIKKQVGSARSNVYYTTMIDLYRIGKYPGAEKRPGENALARVERIEAAMKELLPGAAFLPYVQLHEFETLLFVDLSMLWERFPHDAEPQQLDALRRATRGQNPEDIDDGDHSAPSKRIIRHLGAFAVAKSTIGPLTAGRIGLERLRASCPHFAAWLQRLERLA